MKTIKRSLAGCLAFLLAALSTVSFVFVPVVASAEETNWAGWIIEHISLLTQYTVAQVSALKQGSLSQLVENSTVCNTALRELAEGGHVYWDDSTQKIVVDETAQNTIKEKVQSEIANVEGWWFLQPSVSRRQEAAEIANESGKGPAFLAYSNNFCSRRTWSSGWNRYIYAETCLLPESGYMVGNNATGSNSCDFYFYDDSLNGTKAVVYKSLSYALDTLSGVSSYTPSETNLISINMNNALTMGYFYIGAMPRMVYTSLSSLKLILSSGDISMIDTDPATEPVSISPDVLIKTDWQALNEKQHNELMEELGDIKDYLKGAVTQKEMNELIKKQTKKLNNAIENSTGDIVDAIETEKNILEKILKQMKTLNSNVTDGFNNIAELIGNQGGTSVAFSSEEIVAAITQLQEALLSDNQEFNAQTAELIAKCEELLTAVESGNECVSADLETIKELMQNIVNNTADPDSTINFKAKEIRDFLELMQIDVGKLSETVCKLDVDVLNDLLTKMLTGTDKQSELLEDILKETKKSNALLTASLLVDLFQTVLNGEDDGSLIDDLTMTFQPVAQTASEKFPFSLPKDLYEIVQTLDAEPVAPKFTLPLKFSIGQRNFDNEIDIDLSRFEPLAKICRNGLKLLFLIGLVWLSWHSTGGGGGSGEGGGA